MADHEGSRRASARQLRARVSLAALAICVTSLVATHRPSPIAQAHTPHDQIAQVALSPTFDSDHTGFVISRESLFRSEDGMETFLHRSIGLGDAKVLRIAIAPSDPSIVLIATSDGRVIRSADGGHSFSQSATVFEDAPIVRIAVSPTNPDQIVVTALPGILGRSLDGGVTWSTIEGLGTTTSLAAASTGDGRFYSGSAGGALFVSDDGGGSWLRSRAPSGADVSAIASFPLNPSLVVAGDAAGRVQVSLDGAGSFAEVAAEGLNDSRISELTLSAGPEAEPIIWLTQPEGIYRSDDVGTTFQPASDGIDVDPEAADRDQPGFGNVTVASDGSATFAAAFDGLFQLDDDAWVHVETRADTIVGLAVSPDFATDGNVAITTYVKGAFLSSDRGDTFEAINGGLAREVGRSNTALPVDRLQQLVFSPDFADDRLLLSATEGDLLRSDDAGQRWQTFNVGIRSAGDPTPHFALGAAHNGNTPTWIIGSRSGEIFRSDRDGRLPSWSVKANLESPIRSIMLNPDFARRPDVFVATRRGVFRSNDGGVKFARVNLDIRDALLAISPNYTSDGTVFAGSENGLQVSRDHGETWSPIDLLFESDAPIAGLAVSPDFADDGVVLASISGVGLVRSADGGETFAPTAPDLIAAHLVIGNQAPTPRSAPIVFANDGTVFAHTGETALRSDDSGNSWQILEVPSYHDFDAASTRLVPGAASGNGEAETSDDDDTAVAADSARPAVEVPPLDVQKSVDSDRRIWIVTGSICALVLGFLLLSARRRRGPLFRRAAGSTPRGR